MSWLLMRMVCRSTKIPWASYSSMLFLRMRNQARVPFHGDLAGAFERRVVAHGDGAFDAEIVDVAPQQVGDLGVA